MAPTTIDPRPPFRQIADDLRDAIYSKKLKQGDPLPSERELRERYGVSHSTVRQGLGVLKGEGLVDSVQGLGYFVRQPPARHRRSGVGHFVTQAKEQNLKAEQRLIEVTAPREPSELVAARLQTPEDGLVVTRRYIFLLGDRPVQLAESYFPYDLVKGTKIAQHVDMPGGAQAELQRLGFEVRYFEEELSANVPNPQQSQALRLLAGVPVISLLRTTYATGLHLPPGPQPVEVTYYVLAGDAHTLVYLIPSEERYDDDKKEWVKRDHLLHKVGEE